MESWPAQVKRVRLVMVAELLAKVTRRLVRQATKQVNLLSSAARRRRPEIQQEWAPLRPVMFALPGWQLDPPRRAFFAPTRQ